MRDKRNYGLPHENQWVVFPIDRWDKNRIDRFVAFITRPLVKQYLYGLSGMESIGCLPEWDTGDVREWNQ